MFQTRDGLMFEVCGGKRITVHKHGVSSVYNMVPTSPSLRYEMSGEVLFAQVRCSPLTRRFVPCGVQLGLVLYLDYVDICER